MVSKLPENKVPRNNVCTMGNDLDAHIRSQTRVFGFPAGQLLHHGALWLEYAHILTGNTIDILLEESR